MDGAFVTVRKKAPSKGIKMKMVELDAAAGQIKEDS